MPDHTAQPHGLVRVGGKGHGQRTAAVVHPDDGRVVRRTQPHVAQMYERHHDLPPAVAGCASRVKATRKASRAVGDPG